MKCKLLGIVFTLACVGLFADETPTAFTDSSSESSTMSSASTQMTADEAPAAFTDSSSSAPTQMTTNEAPPAFTDSMTAATKPAAPMQTKPSAQMSNTQPAMVEKTHNRFQIGGNYTHVHMTGSYPHLHGNLGGAQASYEYLTADRIYGGVTLTWRDGTARGTQFRRSIHELDMQERIGYTIGFWNESCLWSLFTGMGYRHFREKVTTIAAPVYFYYNEFYVPVGFVFDGKINSVFSMGLNFQWMPQIYPTVKIVPLKGARWILTNRLDNFLVEVPFTFCLCDNYNVSLRLIPFWELWHDGHSTAKTPTGVALNLPGNAYVFIGVNLNVSVLF